MCSRLFTVVGSVLRPTKTVTNCRFASTSQHAIQARKQLRRVGKMRRNLEKWKKEKEDGDMKMKMYSFEVESLATRGFLRNTKAYTPPTDVESRLNDIAVSVFPQSTNSRELHGLSLKEPAIKYKFLVKCIKDLQHDIPSSQLHKMQTVGDVVAYFKLPVKTTTSYDDLSKSSNLPPNLHVQPEPYRFNPETDTLFGGISAFPGRSTIVTGLKAKKLFKSYIVPAVLTKKT